VTRTGEHPGSFTKIFSPSTSREGGLWGASFTPYPQDLLNRPEARLVRGNNLAFCRRDSPPLFAREPGEVLKERGGRRCVDRVEFRPDLVGEFAEVEFGEVAPDVFQRQGLALYADPELFDDDRGPVEFRALELDADIQVVVAVRRQDRLQDASYCSSIHACVPPMKLFQTRMAPLSEAPITVPAPDRRTVVGLK